MLRGRLIVLNGAALAALSFTVIWVGKADPDFDHFPQWPFAGQNLADTRSPGEEHAGIKPEDVGALAPAWVFTAGGNVAATPTVSADGVYFPDFAGSLFAIDRHTGRLIWSHKISDYDGVGGAISRVSPAIDGDQLIIGDLESSAAPHNGANVMAVDRHTGRLRWITQVDSHPAAIITGSPVVFNHIVFQGVSSAEEGLAINPGYPCCTFRGSVVALDARSGEILWKTFDMPDNGGKTGGYSGGAIWQIPAIDPVRQLLYIGTGNNYSAPAAVEACEAKALANHHPYADCTASDDYFDTALALDLNDGHMRWAKRLRSYDVWTVACILGLSTCPSPPGPDYDLGGSGPNILDNIVGFGEKSGVYWALNPDDGRIVWSAMVGPGGTVGGIQWGTATDGQRIYVAIANNLGTPYKLFPSRQELNWGSWSALDAGTGSILWQTADPTPGTVDMGAVTVANGVVYAGSYSGYMYALDAQNGNILWTFQSGGSVIDGPSIVDRTVYWGSGYSRIPPGIANNKLYAFRPAR